MFDADIALDRLIDQLRIQINALQGQLDAVQEGFGLDPWEFSPAEIICGGLLAEPLADLEADIRSRLSRRLGLEYFDAVGKSPDPEERAEAMLLLASTCFGMMRAQHEGTLEVGPEGAADWVRDVHRNLLPCAALIDQLRDAAPVEGAERLGALASVTSQRAYHETLRRFEEL